MLHAKKIALWREGDGRKKPRKRWMQLFEDDLRTMGREIER